MTLPFVYSPLPVEDYFIPNVPCEVLEITRMQESTGIWNLFWLSNPTIDNVPDAGHQWWKVYQPVQHLLAAVVGDVLDDEALYRKLMAKPAKFIEFWSRQAHRNLRVHGVLGDGWIETVSHRAAQAQQRLVAPVVAKASNVIQFHAFQERRRKVA